MRRRVHKISSYAVLSSAVLVKAPLVFVALLYCSMNWSRVSAFMTADATKLIASPFMFPQSSINCGDSIA